MKTNRTILARGAASAISICMNGGPATSDSENTTTLSYSFLFERRNIAISKNNNMLDFIKRTNLRRAEIRTISNIDSVQMINSLRDGNQNA